MSLVPTREDRAFGDGYRQASESGGAIIDHLMDRLRATEAERDALRATIGLLKYAQEVAADDRYSDEAVGIAFRTAFKNTAHPSPSVAVNDREVTR